MHMTKEMFIRSILPIGLLFSGSLILSNTAYLYLSVAYIQMLKVRKLFVIFAALTRPTGIYTCCYPAYLLDIPYSRSKQKAGSYRVDDFQWCCLGVSRRAEIQLDRIRYPSCRSRRESLSCHHVRSNQLTLPSISLKRLA